MQGSLTPSSFGVCMVTVELVGQNGCNPHCWGLNHLEIHSRVLDQSEYVDIKSACGQ